MVRSDHGEAVEFFEGYERQVASYWLVVASAEISKSPPLDVF